VLGGEPAVPCNPQSATEGLNSCGRILIPPELLVSGVDEQTRRNFESRTLSGPEGSSNKRISRCAAGKFVLS
jgi:hypothetical protein